MLIVSTQNCGHSQNEETHESLKVGSVKIKKPIIGQGWKGKIPEKDMCKAIPGL